MVDMIIPILIAELNSYSRAKTVSSAFRTTDITGLPVDLADMFARWCKKCLAVSESQFKEARPIF